MFWSKCLDGVFISVLVAHLHVKFFTINAPSRHCVFLVSWLSVLVLFSIWAASSQPCPADNISARFGLKLFVASHSFRIRHRSSVNGSYRVQASVAPELRVRVVVFLMSTRQEVTTEYCCATSSCPIDCTMNTRSG